MITQILSLVLATSGLNGKVAVDGSSTVFPIIEALAEAYSDKEPNVRVTVGISGTGGGFKRFIAKEIDITDASRHIKKSEVEACKKAGVTYVEIPIAYDGLTIVVNKKNTWVDNLTMDELNDIFEEGAEKWSDVRPEWPDKKIQIFCPGTDSGTFDYFKEVVIGKSGSMRSDIAVSEDDNVVVKGVMGDDNSLGFFGCSYYFANKDKLRAVPIVNPKTQKAVLPNRVTIENGTYAPFSRPLFIYVNKRSLRRPEVYDFVMFCLTEGAKLSKEVGYVQLPADQYTSMKLKLTR
tara:strand:- start:3548 stop:4423 length:876 start_codon:yes stop_codon:yes gene_type:complete